ncbi:MAG: cobalamin-dependent protein, partial [Chloroflexota bacterium]
MTERLEVYLNEFNLPMGNTIYLPLVSGQLQAYAQTKPEICENYHFMPFLFMRDDPERIMAQYQSPAVAAFSASMWNMNLSLEVAKRVKERFPDCLIVFGGPSVPTNINKVFSFLCEYPFVDVTVRGEGEHTFADLLETRDLKWVKGISYQKDGAVLTNTNRPLEESPDTFPSPYLEGLFDHIMQSGMQCHAIVETARGCPFKCTFCYWGRAEPYRFFSL